MSIAFNQVPGDIEVPLFAAEINAGPPPYSGASRMLLIGRSDETVLPTLTLVNAGSADPSTLCGYGSMLADMLLYARQVNPLGEIYVMAVPASPTGEKAKGAVVITGKAKRAGSLIIYIAGQKVKVDALGGETAEELATKLRNKINKSYMLFGATMGMPVTAALDAQNAKKVVVTARHTGSEGNTIFVSRSMRDGPRRDIPGVTAEITQLTGGEGGGSPADALAAVANEAFDWIGGPYDSASQLDTVRDFLAERWSPLSQLYGHYVTAKLGSISQLTAFGALRNDPHVTTLGIPATSPNPTWTYAAALCGRLAFSKNLGRSISEALEIARPMQTLVLPGFIAPEELSATFSAVDRDSLLRNGISTIVWRQDGQAACDRIVTTYQFNDAGLADSTFHDIEDICIATYVSRYMRNALLGQFPRHVLADDNPNRAQGVVTPTAAKSCVIHAYEQLANAGLVRQAEEFARNLRVEFDYASDRANFFLPASKVSQLRIFAVNITMYTDQTAETTQL